MVTALKIVMWFIVGAFIGVLFANALYKKESSCTNEEECKLRRRGFLPISKEQYKRDFDEDVETTIIMPKRASKLSAGYDCYAPTDIYLNVGEDIKVPTGIRAYMQPGEVLMAFPRSGLGFKYYCRLANTVGIIDADYIQSDNEGHIFVKLRNEGDKPMHIKCGEAMCQFIFMPFLLADEDTFDTGNERNGGFGSTTGK